MSRMHKELLPIENINNPINKRAKDEDRRFIEKWKQPINIKRYSTLGVTEDSS